MSGDSLDSGDGLSAPSPENVRTQLERILGSPHFETAERTRRFLSHIVEETLSGRGERLKEYTLALEVFDRDASFDPAHNPSVRVEASRLRRRLELYYLTLGREDPVLIEIPRGTYVPVFRFKADVLHLQEELEAFDTEDLPAAAIGLSGGPWIAVVPFVNLDEDEPIFAEGVTAEMITALSRFRDFHVIARDTAFKHHDQEGATRIGRDLGVGYVLQGNVRRDQKRVRIHATLASGNTGEILWSDRYERDLSVESIFDIQEEIASQVVATIAQPHGVIARPELARTRHKPLGSLDGYDALLLFYDYTTKFSPVAHARVLSVVESALQNEPDAATLHAFRAFLFLDMYRFGFNLRGTRDEVLQEALESAHGAVKMDPLNPSAYHVLFLAEFSRGDHRAFREAGKRALELNPNDTDTLADFGLHLILSEQVELGRLFLKVALTLNPEPPDWYWVAFFWLYFAMGAFEDALDMVLRVQNDEFYWVHCMQAIVYGKLGNEAEARAAIQRLLRLYPEFPSQVGHELSRWLSPARTAEVLDALREGGLDSAPQRRA